MGCGTLKEQREEAHRWEFRVEDRGFDAAICDKYPDLFDSDKVLRDAHAKYRESVDAINARMAELAAQAKQGERKP
ncbi:hypothetical protein B5M06_14980 [Comamonas kerstersii]|uniref:Uncharacterized protein n=1 Tax=Comamonas kerstersii TaxID=225992 RepID=A0A1V0BHJ2_9BURK|nr:hypothetical protein [Comamonas kerstersii]AQZ99361.1 hypothetical protein B5M06_14980 [Comamonas kerstersii]